MNFNFGEVLSRAWQIIWKHKILWIFGIFAGCSRGGGGGGGGGGTGGGGTPGPGGQPGQPFSGLEQSMQRIAEWIQQNPWIFVVIALVVLVFIVISIFLGTIGRIGLIRGTYQADGGAESLIFGELFSESMPYFWRVCGLSVRAGLVMLVVVLILLIPLIAFGALTAGSGMLCILPVICLLVPLAWAVAVILEQATIAMVLENVGIMEGLSRGWQVVRNNLGTMVLMALILFIGSGIVGFIIAIPILVAVVPVVFAAANRSTTSLWIGLLCCACYLPILLVLNGIITAYMQSAWALTYMRLTRPLSNAPVPVEANG